MTDRAAKANAGQTDLAPRLRPVQQRAKQTVELILDAAADLLEEKGVDSFNTNVLAERAGVAVRSVYRYFPNKLAVIVALAERQQEAWKVPFAEGLAALEDASADVFEAYSAISEAWVRHLASVRGGWAIRRAMQALPELRDLDRQSSEMMARAVAESLRRRGVDIPQRRLEVIARVVMDAFDGVFDEALCRYGTVPRAVLDEIKLLERSYLKNYVG